MIVFVCIKYWSVRVFTCVLQVRKDLEDPRQLCPPSVLQKERKVQVTALDFSGLVKDV